MAVYAKDSSGTHIKGASSTVHYIQNPPFDGRLGQRGAVDATGKFVRLPREQVLRGFMMTDMARVDGAKYLLHFQFNPTSFSHSAALSANIPTQSMPDQGGEGSNWMSFIANTGQSVAFNLLFDRTYETWDSTATTFAGEQGVLADVKTLYAMLGMYGTSDETDPNLQKSVDPAHVDQLTPKSVLSGGNPVWVNFGPLMSYYGIIQSIDVTFTHFTQKMTPVRATVGLSMALIPRVEGRNDLPGMSGVGTWGNVVGGLQSDLFSGVQTVLRSIK